MPEQGRHRGRARPRTGVEAGGGRPKKRKGVAKGGPCGLELVLVLGTPPHRSKRREKEAAGHAVSCDTHGAGRGGATR